MRKQSIVLVAVAALGTVAFVSAQQKPVSSRTPIVVYKSPT
jgi:hypothetical protein